LEVYDTDKLWASAGTKKEKNIKFKHYPLTYTYKNKELNIGELRVTANLDGVYNNMLQGLWVTLSTNAIKTFLVAFFMLFLFQNLVIRHLHKIASEVDRFNISDPDNELPLDRKNNPENKKDELDLVLKSINKLQK